MLRPETKLTKNQREILECQYLRQFIQETNNFWDNPEILVGVIISCKISSRMKTTLATLEHRGGIGRANGKRLTATPREIILTLGRKTLNLTDEDIAKVIRHEVIHIGYLNHGRTFKRYCVEFNASYKGWNISTREKPVYEVQIQKEYGKRFKTIAEFDTEEKARAEYRRQFLSISFGRLRLRVSRPATRADLGGF